jgi:hypothetical protein
LGFGEELGEQTRVSAGNPFRHSDSAVKLSVLAGRLEKPFRLFICRYWHCVFEEIYWRRLSFSDLRRERAFFFGTWEVLGVFFLSWTRPPFPAACGLLDAEFGIFPSRGTLAGRDPLLVVNSGAAYLLGWPCSSFPECVCLSWSCVGGKGKAAAAGRLLVGCFLHGEAYLWVGGC